MDSTALGFGVTGALDLDIIRALAPQLEAAGFKTLWINDTPGGDSLAALATAAAVTTTLQLGSGVIPLDRRPPAEIIARVESLHLPQDRLILGVGSGAAHPALQLVRDGIRDLQDGLECRVVVGALGPNMRKLGAVESSGLLLNWLTPDTAMGVSKEMLDDAREADREPASITLYVRVALGDTATDRLRAEATRYGQIKGYAANFARLGIDGIQASVFGSDSAALQSGLSAYAGTVDEVVVRAITTSDHLVEYEKLLNAVKHLS